MRRFLDEFKFNNKNGKIYNLIGVANNATNEQEGQLMCIYQNEEENVYVREALEFVDKFTISDYVKKQVFDE